MAFDYNTVLKRIIAKAQLLEQRYFLMLKDRDDALAKAEQLQAQVDRQNKQLEQLRLQVEYLQLANTIAPSREQVEKTRALIAGLVRDIDRCITDLSD